METQEKIKVYGVYLGQGEHGHAYKFFSNLEENNGQSLHDLKERRVLFSKKLGNTSVGYIYEFERIDNSISFSKKPTALAYWKNLDDVREWKVLENSWKKSKQELTLPANVNLFELLAPIKEAYTYAPDSQRAVILAEVIKIITKRS